MHTNMHTKIKIIVSLFLLPCGIMKAACMETLEKGRVVLYINSDRDKWECPEMQKFVYRDGDKLVLGGLLIHKNGPSPDSEGCAQKYPQSTLMKWKDFAARLPEVAQSLTEAPSTKWVRDGHDVRVHWGSEELLTKYLRQGSVATQGRKTYDFQSLAALDNSQVGYRELIDGTYTYIPEFARTVLGSSVLCVTRDAWELFQARLATVVTESAQQGTNKLQQLLDDAQRACTMCQEQRKKMVDAVCISAQDLSDELVAQQVNRRLGAHFIDYEKASKSQLERLQTLEAWYKQTTTEARKNCIDTANIVSRKLAAQQARGDCGCTENNTREN